MKTRMLSSFAALAFSLGLANCTQQEQGSNLLVTSVDHTDVKRQSIGNCWIYAQATWLESLLLSAHGEKVNVSETYWTWWHWYDQIVDDDGLKEIQTGGWWWLANDIALQHGWVEEGEFLSEEAESEMSLAQAIALQVVNQELQSGSLSEPGSRTPENVRRVLDEAFGTNMAEAEELARSADDTIVGFLGEEQTPVTLRDALKGQRETRWVEVDFPRVYGQDTVPSESTQERRQKVMRRVLKALNDRKPVVMSLMIDFNALDRQDAAFKLSTLQEVGGPGMQGGHMVVLHDYVVKNAPGFGDIGEGEVSDEAKAAALEGELVYLVAKNSWGSNRPDRGLTDGYSRFYTDYLFSQLEWTRGDSSSWYTTLSYFVLPPGY